MEKSNKEIKANIIRDNFIWCARTQASAIHTQWMNKMNKVPEGAKNNISFLNNVILETKAFKPSNWIKHQNVLNKQSLTDPNLKALKCLFPQCVVRKSA